MVFKDEAKEIAAQLKREGWSRTEIDNYFRTHKAEERIQRGKKVRVTFLSKT